MKVWTSELVLAFYEERNSDSFYYFITGGIFRLELFLPAEYPMGPPKVRFLSKLYHPNVDKIGRICLDILKVYDDIFKSNDKYDGDDYEDNLYRKYYNIIIL